MDKHKLILPISILIGCIILGGFIYASQINKQNSIEKQQAIKIEEDKQEQLAKELKEQEAKEQAEQALNTCLANATEIYEKQWFMECKKQGGITNWCITLEQTDCKKDLDSYMELINIVPLFPDIADRGTAYLDCEKRKSECYCSLPSNKADRLDEGLKNDKDECFKKYPQK